MEASKCKGCGFRLQLKEPHGTFGPREDASPEVVNRDVWEENSQRRALWLGTPAPVLARDWSTRDQIPSPNSYSHQWNLEPSLLACTLTVFLTAMGGDGYLLRLHCPPGLCQEPYVHLLSGALTEPEKWVLFFLPLYDWEHWALVMLCVAVHAYGFPFQRATLKGMERQWLLFFCLSVHNLLGLCSMSRNPSAAAHFSIRDTSLCERYPAGLTLRDS